MSQKQLDFQDTFSEEAEPVEDENDLEKILITELDSAVVQATDWTTSVLLSQIEKGRIELTPAFQRRDAWTAERKGKFIKSLLLNFPIPQLVLAEDIKRRGNYIVIDGKQRLLSLIQFAGSKPGASAFQQLRLSGLEIMSSFNGNTFDEMRRLPSGQALLADFDNRTIRTVVIRNWKHEAVLYHIFLRLNTGSVQLSPQELRNALHPGPFAEFVDERSGTSPALRRVLNSEKPDFRMRDAELLLRYLAFRNSLASYRGSMKTFLDDVTENYNTNWQDLRKGVATQAREFEEGVKLAYAVFGEKDAFRKWRDGAFVGKFNRAVFDVIIFYFCRPEIRDKIIRRKIAIKKGFVKMSKDNPKFVESVESTTKSLGAVTLRLSLWTAAINRILKTDFPIPKLVNSRIVTGK